VKTPSMILTLEDSPSASATTDRAAGRIGGARLGHDTDRTFGLAPRLPWLNVTRLSDALDEDASSLLRVTEDDGSQAIVRIRNHAFVPERRHGSSMFKVAQLPRSYNYVTDEFVGRVREHGLTGFRVREVW